jgi:hypothetical protein
MTTPDDAPAKKSALPLLRLTVVCFVIGMNKTGEPPPLWIWALRGSSPAVFWLATEAEVITRVPGANPAKVHDAMLVSLVLCVHIWL